MKTKMKNQMLFILLPIMALMLTSACEDLISDYIDEYAPEDDDGNNDDDLQDDDGGDGDDDADSTVFALKIMDAPVDEATAVTITINAILVHYAGEIPPEGDDDDDDVDDDDDDVKGDDDDDDDDDDEGEGTWIDLDLDVTTINLLDFQNGLNETLSEAELPVGEYTQIRLMLDCVDNPATITIDGVEHELFIPSGCQSGVKLVNAWTLAEGEDLSLILDFDLRKSIHQTGSGRYTLQPTIRVIEESQVGSISGSVLPADLDAVAYAYEDGQYPDGDYVNSTMSDESGNFVLAALPMGKYDVVVTAEGFEDIVIEDVNVVAQQDTPLGTIEFQAGK